MPIRNVIRKYNIVRFISGRIQPEVSSLAASFPSDLVGGTGSTEFETVLPRESVSESKVLNGADGSVRGLNWFDFKLFSTNRFVQKVKPVCTNS